MEYKNEVMFYLSHNIMREFLSNNDYVLIDIFYELMQEITNDYLKNYDNANKSLLDSINDYINLRKDYIKENLQKIYETF